MIIKIIKKRISLQLLYLLFASRLITYIMYAMCKICENQIKFNYNDFSHKSIYS